MWDICVECKENVQCDLSFCRRSESSKPLHRSSPWTQRMVCHIPTQARQLVQSIGMGAGRMGGREGGGEVSQFVPSAHSR